MRRKRIALLGSTGSIGVQTLDVVAQHRDKFEVVWASTHTQVELLKEQVERFSIPRALITDPSTYQKAKNTFTSPTKLGGIENLEDLLVDEEVDVVLVAWVGFSGLDPVLKALSVGKQVALANKEAMVVGGELIQEILHKGVGTLIPIDSEHSA
ncbi:MAG: 1-deoxy-D-xylulose-5-phosphate reductoisomerase, partial [Cytophagales bacterium]|nr:1-deoxy-D-xylulose-5-phosphate reductoisomerase [Cytophagales bacterium]